MPTPKELKKSRTIRCTDSEWNEITMAAIELGFGENGRSKTCIRLAVLHNRKTKIKGRG